MPIRYDEVLRERLKALAQERRRFGYRRLHVLLRREGHAINKKRVQRLYREERLTVRRRGGRKRAIGTRRPMVTPQPNPDATVEPYVAPIAPGPSRDALIAQLRSKVKYVFVIFNENHSFDHEYGTFPGVNGIYSDGINPRSPANTPGFTQTYQDVNGKTVRPAGVPEI